jgi:hypothetical protein
MQNVPGKGVFTFGGVNTGILTSQQLPRIDGSWTYGPDLFQLQNDYGQCAVQVSNYNNYKQGKSLGILNTFFEWTCTLL